MYYLSVVYYVHGMSELLFPCKEIGWRVILSSSKKQQIVKVVHTTHALHSKSFQAFEEQIKTEAVLKSQLWIFSNVPCCVSLCYNSVISHSLSFRYKPVRPFVHLKDKLRYFWWNPRAFWPWINSNTTTTFKVVMTLLKQSMWHRSFNCNFMKLRE